MHIYKHLFVYGILYKLLVIYSAHSDNHCHIFLGLLSTSVDMWTLCLWVLWITLCITHI